MSMFSFRSRKIFLSVGGLLLIGMAPNLWVSNAHAWGAEEEDPLFREVRRSGNSAYKPVEIHEYRANIASGKWEEFIACKEIRKDPGQHPKLKHLDSHELESIKSGKSHSLFDQVCLDETNQYGAANHPKINMAYILERDHAGFSEAQLNKQKRAREQLEAEHRRYTPFATTRSSSAEFTDPEAKVATLARQTRAKIPKKFIRRGAPVRIEISEPPNFMPAKANYLKSFGNTKWFGAGLTYDHTTGMQGEKLTTGNKFGVTFSLFNKPFDVARLVMDGASGETPIASGNLQTLSYGGGQAMLVERAKFDQISCEPQKSNMPIALPKEAGFQKEIGPFTLGAKAGAAANTSYQRKLCPTAPGDPNGIGLSVTPAGVVQPYGGGTAGINCSKLPLTGKIKEFFESSGFCKSLLEGISVNTNFKAEGQFPSASKIWTQPVDERKAALNQALVSNAGVNVGGGLSIGIPLPKLLRPIATGLIAGLRETPNGIEYPFDKTDLYSQKFKLFDTTKEPTKYRSEVPLKNPLPSSTPQPTPTPDAPSDQPSTPEAATPPSNAMSGSKPEDESAEPSTPAGGEPPKSPPPPEPKVSGTTAGEDDQVEAAEKKAEATGAPENQPAEVPAQEGEPLNEAQENQALATAERKVGANFTFDVDPAEEGCQLSGATRMAGKLGQSLQVRTGQFAVCTAKDINPNAKDFTLSFWVNPHSSWFGKNLTLLWNGEQTGWRIVFTNNHLRFAVGAKPNHSLVSSRPIIMSGRVWYHVAIVVKESKVGFFLNGTPLNVTDAGDTLNVAPTVSNKFTIAPHKEVDARLDDIGFFNAALDEAAILALYNEGNGKPVLEYQKTRAGRQRKPRVISRSGISIPKIQRKKF